MIDIVPKNIHPCFRYSYVISLCDVNVPVPHLITEQMRGRIHFRHPCSEGVPQVVILELNSQLLFDFSRRIFHAVDGLDLPIWQAIDQFG